MFLSHMDGIMVLMTYLKGFMTLQNPMRVYHLCVGGSDASEGVYRTIGECYDLPGEVY